MSGSGQVLIFVISRATSDRFFTEITFSATELVTIDWNGDILRDLDQNMTISDLRHRIFTFRRSSEVADLDQPLITYSG